MKYQIITVESMGISQDHVIIERDDGSFVSFPADPENPNYQQFLKDLEVTP